METKNLNKKVGCALIAASLLAASSVQGSSAQGVSTLEGSSTFNSGDVAKIRYATVMRSNGFGFEVEFGFYLLQGYQIVVGPGKSNWAGQLLIALVKDSDEASLEKLMEQRFPGLKGYSLTGTQIQMFAPEGFIPAVLPNGTISILPAGCRHAISPAGSLLVILSDGSLREVTVNRN
ncbi:MAG: hypothetical protein LBF34_02590 [Puniceicoccales bacterium]|jgi:hypothetical protein|nr:hypothetical protein [Puniceicoccales bacterium]